MDANAIGKKGKSANKRQLLNCSFCEKFAEGGWKVRPAEVHQAWVDAAVAAADRAVAARRSPGFPPRPKSRWASVSNFPLNI